MRQQKCGAKDPSICRYHGSPTTRNNLNAKAARALKDGDTRTYLEAKEQLEGAKSSTKTVDPETLAAKESFLKAAAANSSIKRLNDTEYEIDSSEALEKLSDSLEDDEVEVEWDKPVSGYDTIRSIHIIKTGVTIENTNYSEEIQDVASPEEVREFLWTD